MLVVLWWFWFSFRVASCPFQMKSADPSVDALGASALLREWFLDGEEANNADWDADKAVLSWMENKVSTTSISCRFFP